MKIDAIIAKLLPHDEKFFTLLEQSATNLSRAGVLLKTFVMTKEPKKRTAIAASMTDLEHEGDSITHNIFAELNSTFVTPLDREDIHVIASALDDIMDFMEGSVKRFELYNVSSITPPMIQFADILAHAIEEVERGIKLLRHMDRHEDLQRTFEKINEYENDADRVFEEAVSHLFRKEKNPLNLIKLKEVYGGLEAATDKCEDVANVLEAIMIKNA